MIYKNYKKRYNEASIYMLINIFDNQLKNSYIGTTTNWSVRKYQHKRRCNDPNDSGYNFPLYKCIRKTGGFDNWKMVKIEDFPCKNEKELNARENYWIELYNSKLNTNNKFKY